MTSCMFTATARFSNSLELMQRVPAAVLPKLLARILPTLRSATDGSKGSFATKELEKLEKMLKVSSAELLTILEAGTYIFERAAMNTASAAKLSADLTEVGMVAEQVAIFAAVWAGEGKALVASMRENSSFGAPAVLVDSKWSLGVAVGSADSSHVKESSATVELTIAPSPSIVDRAQFERVTMEFNHAELSDFFLKMDQVQRQLDALSES